MSNVIELKPGTTFKTNDNSEFVIVSDNGWDNVVVMLVDEKHNYTRVVTRDNIRHGRIKNPYKLNKYNGYIGDGKYKSKHNRKQVDSYVCWINMLKRCYDDEVQKKQPTYKGVTVCDEWHNFQNFAKWYDENYYNVDGDVMCLDKDILDKGNKVYSPETCILVPKRINSLFVKNDSVRGNLPIGVTYKKAKSKDNDKDYIVQLSTLYKNGNVFIGSFSTPDEAFYAYKKAKEDYIKQVAEQYKNKIPKVLYNAMYRYEVEISD